MALDHWRPRYALLLTNITFLIDSRRVYVIVFVCLFFGGGMRVSVCVHVYFLLVCIVLKGIYNVV